MDLILEIKRLKSIYPNAQAPALICNNIKLYRSQIYFVIGKSGIGKSTFLESTGLMSNTIKEEENSIFYHEEASEISLSEVWRGAGIAEFRAKNYAFIFQENNLMKHFTAGENMSFGLLQSGKSMEEAKSIILPIMHKLGLSETYYDAKIQNLSGGERQRIAFIRAITADFSILFCDEPTGNLDPNLADKLMRFLKKNILEACKTAIIVSHDIGLAMKFADQILIIRAGKESNGILESNQVLKRVNEEWEFLSGEKIPNIQDYLIQSII